MYVLNLSNTILLSSYKYYILYFEIKLHEHEKIQLQTTLIETCNYKFLILKPDIN